MLWNFAYMFATPVLHSLSWIMIQKIFKMFQFDLRPAFLIKLGNEIECIIILEIDSISLILWKTK